MTFTKNEDYLLMGDLENFKKDLIILNAIIKDTTDFYNSNIMFGFDSSVGNILRFYLVYKINSTEFIKIAKLDEDGWVINYQKEDKLLTQIKNYIEFLNNTELIKNLFNK